MSPAKFGSSSLGRSRSPSGREMEQPALHGRQPAVVRPPGRRASPQRPWVRRPAPVQRWRAASALPVSGLRRRRARARRAPDSANARAFRRRERQPGRAGARFGRDRGDGCIGSDRVGRAFGLRPSSCSSSARFAGRIGASGCSGPISWLQNPSRRRSTVTCPSAPASGCLDPRRPTGRLRRPRGAGSRALLGALPCHTAPVRFPVRTLAGRRSG